MLKLAFESLILRPFTAFDELMLFEVLLLYDKLFDVFDPELVVDKDALELLIAFDEWLVCCGPLCNEPGFELLTIVVDDDDEADDDAFECPIRLELELLTTDVDDNDDTDGDDCCETILAQDRLDADVFEVDELGAGRLLFDDEPVV